MKDGRRLLVGLSAGLAGGLLIGASHNAALINAADAVGLAGTLWVNAIRMTVIPLVVSLLVAGVASASDVSMISRIGARTIGVFIAMLASATALALPLGITTFAWLSRAATVRPELPPGAAEAAASLATGTPTAGFADWLTALIPTNPIAAAANGAMLPLIFFTLLLALGIARSSAESRETLIRFFRALSEAMLVIVCWIVQLAPIGVFALMLSLGAHGGAGLVGAIGFYILTYSLGCILFVLLLYPLVAIAARIPMREFARAVLPGQLIAFSSSSSLASLPALVRGAEEDLRLRADVTGFVLPLSVTTFKFSAPVSWTFGTLFIAWFYHVNLGPTAYATIAFTTTFLGIIAPGVPRGAFLMLAPLFLSIGLPVEGVGILIAVDAIPDLFSTVLNTSGYLAATVIVGRGARVESPSFG